MNNFSPSVPKLSFTFLTFYIDISQFVLILSSCEIAVLEIRSWKWKILHFLTISVSVLQHNVSDIASDCSVLTVDVWNKSRNDFSPNAVDEEPFADKLKCLNVSKLWSLRMFDSWAAIRGKLFLCSENSKLVSCSR